MDLNTYLQNQIETHLQEAPEDGPKLLPLLETGTSLASQKKVWEGLTHLCSAPEVQKCWAEWTNIRDREELRLRLQLIEQFDTLEEELIDFIWFFYRSSDPVMYQLACRIVGKQLPHQPKLQSYFRHFLLQRSLSLQTPFGLSNQRSKRRLLLTLASYGAYHGKQLTLDEETIELNLLQELDSITENQELSNADLSILLLSISILCAPESHFKKELKPVGKQLLEKVANNRTKLSREIIMNWGSLAGCLTEDFPSLVKTNFQSLFVQVINKVSGPTSQQVFHLTLLDEMVRNLLFLQYDFHKSIRSLSQKAVFSPPILLFLKLRFAFWSAREGTPLPKALFKTKSSPNSTGSPFLKKFEKTLHNAFHTTDQTPSINANSLYELFNLLLHNISLPQIWFGNNNQDRAFIAFFLIDLSIHSGFISPQESQQLFGAYGFSGYSILKADISVPQNTQPKGSTASICLSATLPQLIELEPDIQEGLLDARVIHRISSPRILIALLPSSSQTEVLPLFADAFEHIFRIQLEMSPQFRPAVFIYKTLIRQPHPRFYTLFLELTKDRQYIDNNGEQVPLHDLLQQAKNLIEKDNSALSSQQDLLSASTPDSEFQTALSTIQSRLANVSKVDDPITGLVRLEEVLHISNRERLHANAGLIELIWNVNDSTSYLIQSGDPPYRTTEKGETLDKITQWLDELDIYQREFVPNSLDNYEDVQEDSLECRILLTRIEQYFLPVLGPIEATLLQNGCSHLKQLIREEEELMGHLAHQLDNQKGPQHLSVEDWEQVFTQITDEREGTVLLLLPVAWEYCYQPQKSSTASPQLWEKKFSFLHWAAEEAPPLHHSSASIQNSWQQLIISSWSSLLQEMMEEQQEYRVSLLLQQAQTPHFPPMKNITEQLVQAKEWCFDRHNWLLAHKCRKVNVQSSAFVWKTCLQYIGHFSKVWIALFVGVILMFDFGDAWTAMAKIGDVQGITLTFLLGITGTFLYVYADLRKKINVVPEEKTLLTGLKRIGRISVFVGLALMITTVITVLAWFLLSGTEEVVQGPNAPLHIIVWTGFALFVGIFFGLIGKVD